MTTCMPLQRVPPRWVARFLGNAGLALLCGCVGAGARSDRPLFASQGMPWTIECMELGGLDRIEQLERVADMLRQTPGIRADEVFVRDDSDGIGRLYYGTYYRRVQRNKEKQPLPARMRADLDLLRQLGDASGRRYFLRALPTRLPPPDVGDPQWALRHVSAKYSLQVAVFEPTDRFWDYKKAAAEYCAWLREKGYEAYYHHGQACSMVTIGAFGPHTVTVDAQGKTYYSSDVLALQRDELLKHNLVNGAVVRVRNDSGQKVAVPSMLVEVPRAAGTEN